MFSVNLDKESDTVLAYVAENKYSQQVQVTVSEVSKALLGKEHQIRLALCCLFSGGHLLIEDLPGMAAIVILLVGLVVVRIDRSAQRKPVVKLYVSLSKELEKVGLPRERGEGPLHYRDRVIAARPELSEIMTELTDLYVGLSYVDRDGLDSASKDQLKHLKSMLNQLRFKVSPLSGLGKTT